MASEMESNPYTIAGKCISRWWCCGWWPWWRTSKQPASHESSIGLESNAMDCGAVFRSNYVRFILKLWLRCCNTLKWHGSTFAGPTTLRPVTRSRLPLPKESENALRFYWKFNTFVGLVNIYYILLVRRSGTDNPVLRYTDGRRKWRRSGVITSLSVEIESNFKVLRLISCWWWWLLDHTDLFRIPKIKYLRFPFIHINMSNLLFVAEIPPVDYATQFGRSFPRNGFFWARIFPKKINKL